MFQLVAPTLFLTLVRLLQAVRRQALLLMNACALQSPDKIIGRRFGEPLRCNELRPLASLGDLQCK